MPSPGDPYTAPVSKVDYELVRAFVVGAVPHPVVVSGKVLSRIPGDSVSADRPAQAGAREPAHVRGQGPAGLAVHPVRPWPSACDAWQGAEAGLGHRRVRPRIP